MKPLWCAVSANIKIIQTWGHHMAMNATCLLSLLFLHKAPQLLLQQLNYCTFTVCWGELKTCFTICWLCNLDLPPATLRIYWFWEGEVSNLQRHVHNCRHPSSGGGPGGGPETLPGGAAWFIHMYMAIHNAWHHHTVTHIQHLSPQLGYIVQKIIRSVRSMHLTHAN